MRSTRILTATSIVGLAACGAVPSGTPDATTDPTAPDAAPLPIDAAPVCPPNTATCAEGVLTVCDEGGQLRPPVTCALGCFTDATRCFEFEPSNGLGPSLTGSASRPDLVLAEGATIDTRSGEVRDRFNTLLPIESALVATPAGPMVRVFQGATITLGDVIVSGPNPVAFVSAGPITVRGLVSVNGTRERGGPGSRSANCVTGYRNEYNQSFESGYTEEYGNHFPGGGGGAHATPGASGGSHSPGVAGGGGRAVPATDVSLVGGCFGGGVYAWLDDDESTYDTHSVGGGGGGAIQVVSLQRITLLVENGKAGAINAGGGGGNIRGGGAGAGGRIVLEAPEVTVTGAGAALAANGGGGGGGCDAAGADGQPNATPAAGGRCSVANLASGGNGAAGTTAPATGGAVTSTVNGRAGGGGGAVGRIVIVTKNGAITQTSDAFVSPPATVTRLTPQ